MVFDHTQRAKTSVTVPLKKITPYLWLQRPVKEMHQHSGRGTLGVAEHRSTAKKFDKYRNTTK